MLDTQGNKITWLGHASFKITTPDGRVILIDPWISGPACPPELKSFDRVDILLVTHGHFDHFADVLPIARQYQPKLVAINETGIWLESKNVPNLAPMGKGGTQSFDDVSVSMVHAIHSNSIIDDGRIVYAGEPAGFVVKLPGNFSVYHAGDTALFGDMRFIGEIHRPDLALLPIGDHYTMGPREAAHAIRLLGVRQVVPMHYGTFPVLTGTPEMLKEETGDVAGLKLHTMQPGETLG